MLPVSAITLDDLQDAKAPPIQLLDRMRDSHHGLARLVARGVRDVEISAITGYHTATISRLKVDPTFGELVQHYRTCEDAVELDLTQRMGVLAADAIQEMHQRLVEDPSSLSASDLREMAKLTLDRIGMGPSKTVNQNNLNATIGPEDMARIRAQPQAGGVKRLVHEPSQSPIIDAVATEVATRDGAQAPDPTPDPIGSLPPGAPSVDPDTSDSGGQGQW